MAFFAVRLEFSLRSKRIASEALPLPAFACRLPGCARPKIRSSTPKNWGSPFKASSPSSYAASDTSSQASPLALLFVL